MASIIMSQYKSMVRPTLGILCTVLVTPSPKGDSKSRKDARIGNQNHQRVKHLLYEAKQKCFRLFNLEKDR